MKITLEIEDRHIDDFLKLIQPLTYISKKEGDWYTDLSKAQKESIDIGLKDIELGNLVADSKVRYGIKKKIEAITKK